MQFPHGLPTIDHAIVTVEVFERIDLQPDADDLPLNYQGVPISYLSLNDFLNLAVNLRTSPELLEYLNVRRSLPMHDLRVMGDERSLFECYLLEGASLGGAQSRAEAATIATQQHDRLNAALIEKSESDRYSTLLEQVADELATRLPDYAANIPAALVAHFDPPDARTGYLKLQGVLAGLRLRERAELGRAFHEVILTLQPEKSGFIYKSVWIDSQPDWVFVFGSSKGIERPEVLTRLGTLVTGAIGFYKRNCFAVIDRDSVGYEVGMCILGSSPLTSAEQKIGQELFGGLRTGTVPIRLGA